MNSPLHPVEQEELMAYLDGELSAERAARVAAHLEECGECRAAIAESRGLSERLSAWQVEPAPQSLTENVTAAAAARKLKPQGTGGPVPPRIFGLPRWVWGTAGGACLLLSIVAISIPNLLRSRIASNSPAYPRQPVGGGGGARGGVPAYPLPQNFSNYDSALANRAGPPTAETYKQWLAPNAKSAPQGESVGGGVVGPPVTGPMIVRTASLKLLTKEFDKTREALEGVVRRHRGYSAELTVGGESRSAHTLSATFRVPADQLDAGIAEIKQLAHVEQESQGGEEVTEQYVDLQARLSNARRTEQTLLDILEKRTGKLAEVLEVEQELARVREEIERMEGELKSLTNRVSYATLRVELREEYKAELEMTPPSVGGRLRNALVEGYRTAVDSLVAMVLFLLKVGPFLMLWALILFWPVRYVWRRVRVAGEPKQASSR